MVKKMASSNPMNIAVLLIVLVAVNWGVFEYFQAQNKAFFELVVGLSYKYIIILIVVSFIDVIFVKLILSEVREYRMFRKLSKNDH